MFQVKYSLVQTTDATNFRIEGDLLMTGSVPLDYERKKNYVLKIKAEDSAPSSLSANQGRPNSGKPVGHIIRNCHNKQMTYMNQYLEDFFRS